MNPSRLLAAANDANDANGSRLAARIAFFMNLPECARPRAQQSPSLKQGWKFCSRMKIRQLLRPRTGALRFEGPQREMAFGKCSPQPCTPRRGRGRNARSARQFYTVIKPWRMAYRVSAATLLVPSLTKMCWRWVSTVLGLISRSEAMLFVFSPCAR